MTLKHQTLKVLVPLRFTGGPSNEKGQRWGTTFNVQGGKFVEKVDWKKPSCRIDMSAARYDSARENYDITFPAGTEFAFEYVAGNHFDSDIVHFRGIDDATLTYLSVHCRTKGHFGEFSEVKDLVRGILSLE